MQVEGSTTRICNRMHLRARAANRRAQFQILDFFEESNDEQTRFEDDLATTSKVQEEEIARTYAT